MAGVGNEAVLRKRLAFFQELLDVVREAQRLMREHPASSNGRRWFPDEPNKGMNS